VDLFFYRGPSIFYFLAQLQLTDVRPAPGFSEGQMIAIMRKISVLFMLIGLSFGLMACAADEQDRVLSYKKGTYLGKVDQQLSEDQLRQLMLRSNGQRGF
jgi:hypothetical protein